MSKKKITLILIPVAALILLVTLFIYNSCTFTIENNDKVIKYKIEAFISRGTTPESK